MKALLAGLVLIATAACGSRQIDVQTGAPPASEVSLRVTNNFTQAVNVYIVQGGSPTFQKQVAARATEVIPVQGIAAGSSVVLRASLVDGSRTVNSPSVILNGTYNWTVP
jgi:hypothetical protein